MLMKSIFNNRGLSLERLAALSEVARSGGIAALAPGDTAQQSKISSQIKGLSEYFGIELTKRKGRGIELTAAGEELVRLSREFFLGLENLVLRCKNAPSTIAIGAGDSLLSWLIIPRLELIESNLDGVIFQVFNMKTARIVSDLQDLTLDFGLLREDMAPVGFESCPLGTFEYRLLVPKTLMASMKEKPTAECIFRLPLVMIRTHWGMVFSDIVEQRFGFQPNIRMICDSFTQAGHALATGKYSAVMPGFAISQLRSQDFEIVFPELPQGRTERRRQQRKHHIVGSDG